MRIEFTIDVMTLECEECKHYEQLSAHAEASGSGRQWHLLTWARHCLAVGHVATAFAQVLMDVNDG